MQKHNSFVLGMCTLIGLIVGLFARNIMVWTFVGLAIGYVITFWIPYFRHHRISTKNNLNNLEQTK